MEAKSLPHVSQVVVIAAPQNSLGAGALPTASNPLNENIQSVDVVCATARSLIQEAQAGNFTLIALGPTGANARGDANLPANNAQLTWAEVVASQAADRWMLVTVEERVSPAVAGPDVLVYTQTVETEGRSNVSLISGPRSRMSRYHGLGPGEEAVLAPKFSMDASGLSQSKPYFSARSRAMMQLLRKGIEIHS